MREVILMVPCFVDLLFPRVGQAAVKLLEAGGCRVHYPLEQTCCGQPAYNCGRAAEARAVAERFVGVFRRAVQAAGEGAVIVVPSASCAAMAGHELERLGLAAPAPTFELCTFLEQELGISSTGATLGARVALFSSCHQLRMLGGDASARRLLGSVVGLELVGTGEEESCCGFGGTFSVKQPDVSAAMGRTKLAAARRAGAEAIVVTDSSCGMQLAGLLDRNDSSKRGTRVWHAAEVLAGMAT